MRKRAVVTAPPPPSTLFMRKRIAISFTLIFMVKEGVVPMTHAYMPTRFDVSEQVPSLSGPLSIAAWVFAPPSLPAETSPVVLVCLPGGSYTKAYYHLEVSSFPLDVYSFALHMVKQGFVVVARDHLGVGERTWRASGLALTL